MQGVSFASDNNSGVHPRILQALADANTGHVVAYGADLHTESAREAFKETFGPDAEPFFVFLGTGANVLGLASLCRTFHAVICADVAHINVDECGAPEHHGGYKLLPVPGRDGKLHPDDVRPLLHGFGFEHHSQPRVLSLTQATELGTVYTLEEIQALAGLAHEHGMLVHMDGARLANAAVALGCSLADMTTNAGVDVLSFGGTKNGLMFGEAVVFLNPALGQEVADFKYVRKQGMQLASKMRYIAAQFDVLLREELWRENARNANETARLLADAVGRVPGVTVTRPVESNAVFATMPAAWAETLMRDYFFYVWNPDVTTDPEPLHEVRWMTSFDTTREQVEGFARALAALAG